MTPSSVSSLFVPCAVGLLLAVAPAQSVVVPSALASQPGNAALSLPLRWSHGVLQVRIDAQLLPASLQGQSIQGVRLRRPAFLGEPAYGATTRTLTVRGGFQPETAGQITVDLAANRPANLTVLFGPAPVTVPATPATGPGTTVGPELLHVPFSQPLPVATGSLFLEFEAGDAPLQVVPGHWVDALWLENGIETGYVVTVGDGSCTTRPQPTELRWNAATGPQVGGTAAFVVTGALPANAAAGLVLHWIGLDPQTAPPGPIHFGFGTDLGPLDPGLAGCRWWAPMLITWFGTTDPTGRIETTLPLAPGVLPGMRLGVQAA